MARGQFRTCQVCGENYDCGEIHHCEGPVEPRPEPPRKVDKHLELCRRRGFYVQPGFKLERKR